MITHLIKCLGLLSFIVFAEEDKSTLPIPTDVEATHILSYPKKESLEFDMEEALKLCQQYRSLYSLKYFYIYCGFNWSEKYIKEFGIKERPYYIFLGTKIQESDGYWGYRRSEEPIWDKYFYSKIEMSEYKKHKLLQLSVWGVGDLSALEWKTLYPEMTPGMERNYATFYRRGEAYLWCQEILKEKLAYEWKNNSIYDGAKCHVFYDKEAKAFIFEIKSQNPFL